MERCRLLPIRGWPKSILMLLAYHHNPKTGQCDPAVETLAVESGAHHETVSAALEKLKRLGVISARHRGPTSPAYTIHFEVFDAIGKSRGHFDPKPPEKAEGIATPSPRKNRQMPPEKTANAPGKSGDKPKEPKEPKDEAAAGRSRPAAKAQAGRDASTPDPKSEPSSPVAARARERSLALSHAHDSGREGMSAAADDGASEARQEHEPEGGLQRMPADWRPAPELVERATALVRAQIDSYRVSRPEDAEADALEMLAIFREDRTIGPCRHHTSTDWSGPAWQFVRKWQGNVPEKYKLPSWWRPLASEIAAVRRAHPWLTQQQIAALTDDFRLPGSGRPRWSRHWVRHWRQHIEDAVAKQRALVVFPPRDRRALH